MASVNICPKTETEVLIASRRLGCNNHTNDRDPYMCIPNKEKTSLVEFCYNSVMGIHEKGNCLEASVGMVTEYSCKNFSYGCPDKTFFKDEFYKYPACQDINTKYHCYVMDPSCPRHSNYESTVNYDTIIYACVIVGGIAIPIIIGAILSVFCKAECTPNSSRSSHNTMEKQAILTHRENRSVSELHVQNPKGPSTAPESHVTEEDLMSKHCKSGSANELDATPQECSFEIEDDDETKVLASPVAAKKTKSSSDQPLTSEGQKKDQSLTMECQKKDPTSTNRSRCTGCVPCCKNKEDDVK